MVSIPPIHHRIGVGGGEGARERAAEQETEGGGAKERSGRSERAALAVMGV